MAFLYNPIPYSQKQNIFISYVITSHRDYSNTFWIVTLSLNSLLISVLSLSLGVYQGSLKNNISSFITSALYFLQKKNPWSFSLSDDTFYDRV